MKKKDFLQSSEKLWGATASFVKAVAEHKGISHNGHAQLFKVISAISREKKDERIDILFRAANTLHTNFYENWLTPHQVIKGKDEVEELIEKLKKILEDKK